MSLWAMLLWTGTLLDLFFIVQLLLDRTDKLANSRLELKCEENRRIELRKESNSPHAKRGRRRANRTRIAEKGESGRIFGLSKS